MDLDIIFALYGIAYMILGLYIYHSMFEVYYFRLGKALLGELVGALIFAAIMTGLTLKFWVISAIILVLIGLGLSTKRKSKAGRYSVREKYIVILNLRYNYLNYDFYVLRT